MLLRLWVKLKSAVQARLRQRLTRGGLLFSAASVMVAVAALVSANNLLFLMLATMLATLLVSGFISRLTLAGLGLDFVLPEHISARRKVAARMLVRNRKGWMPSFSIHLSGTPPSALSTTLYFPAIPGKSRLEETVEAVFGRRGRHRENSFQLSTRFPFGFTERRARVTLRREVLVYPCLEPQPGFEELLASVIGELEAHQRGRGDDFYRIRPYEPLESARHVDWRATAHTGELQVREFARDEEPLVEIFLDLDVAAAHEAWFEKAVDCGAFLAWRVSQREARVRFRTQDFDLCLPAEGDVYDVLKHLALVSPQQAGSLLEPGDADSTQVVFSTRPEQAAEAGWFDALLLHPGAFPFSGPWPADH
jgi:uncharacterized protein (DUF58 family)